jgi:orotidine-5'-phosphate decarboxylase
MAAKEGKGDSDLKVLCVTLLTSLDQQDVREVYGYEGPLEDFVQNRAAKSIEWGCDGVIAAPTEISAIRRLSRPDQVLIVTPGIRPEGSKQDDQKRISTPAAAIEAGADYLVVGRPIIQQPDPAKAARNILAEMKAGFEAR